MKRLLLLAGEESGLLYAREIAEKARAAHPGLEIRGYADSGFATHDLAVMGFWPVVKKIFFFLRVKKTLERVIDTWRPDAVCTVDYPGLNLKLAAYAKTRGVRTVHVVCPQVWAWKAGRIPKIEAALDRLCCFFPFEPKLFRPGFAEFIGHPLASAFAAEEKVEVEGGQRKVLALLPGSRLGEIEKILPTLLAAVEGVAVEIVIPAANERAEQAIRRIVARRVGYADGAGRLRIQRGGARELLRRATCAVVASGTATLEAALARCPTMLVYKVDRLLAWFARRVIKTIRHVGLANIIWEKCDPAAAAGGPGPMPELLQEAFTSANVRRQLDLWLSDETARQAAMRRLDAAMDYLRVTGDPLGRVVDALECPTARV